MQTNTLSLELPRDWLLLILGSAATLWFAYAVLGETRSAFMICPILVLWLGSTIWQRRALSSTGLEGPFVIGLSVLAITTFLSSDPRRSLNELCLALIYVFWFYLVFDLVRRGWPYEAVVGSLLIISVWGIAEGLVEASPWFAEWIDFLGHNGSFPEPIRVKSVFGHANYLSAFLVAVTPIGLSRLLRARRWYLKLALGLWLTSALVVQFLTSSRGGWLGTVVGLGTLFVLVGMLPSESGHCQARHWWRRWRGHGLLMLSVLSLSLLTLMASGYMAWQQLQHPSHGPGLSARQPFYQAALAAFRDSPWYGVGPSTFSSEWLKHNLLQFQNFYTHAHSVPLTILAEQGVLGIMAFLLVVGTGFRMLWLSWKRSLPQQKLFLAATIASLTGLAVHGLFEDFSAKLPVMLTLLAMLSTSLALAQSQQPENHRAESGLLAPLLVVAVVLYVAIGFWSFLGLVAFDDAVRLAEAGEWEEAVSSFDRAVRLDGGFSFYHFQRGYALGVIAADGRNLLALHEAIHAYERGLGLEPYYGLNHANLFALYWQAGRWEEAVTELRSALDLARYSLYDREKNSYGQLVFGRNGIPSELLPQLKRFVSPDKPITPDTLGLFTKRMQRYRDLERLVAEGDDGVARFANGVLLLHSEVLPMQAAPSEGWDVELIWFVPGSLPAGDYSASVWLRNTQLQSAPRCDLNLLSNQDIPSAYKDGLISTWECKLDSPPGLRTGACELQCELHDALTVDRVPLVGDNSGKDSFTIGRVEC